MRPAAAVDWFYNKFKELLQVFAVCPSRVGRVPLFGQQNVSLVSLDAARAGRRLETAPTTRIPRLVVDTRGRIREPLGKVFRA